MVETRFALLILTARIAEKGTLRMAVFFFAAQRAGFFLFSQKKMGHLSRSPQRAVRGRRLTGCAWGEDTVMGCARAVPCLIMSVTRAADPAHMHGSQCFQHCWLGEC